MKRVICLLALSCFTALGGVRVGEPLPNLKGLFPAQALPVLKGKVVLVDFWASWCAPCVKSFPVLNDLQQTYGPKGFVIVGIGLDDSASKHKAFAKKMKTAFALVHDSQKKAARFFDPPSMPTSYLIDKKGIVRYIHEGFRAKKTAKLYVKEIETLLAQ